MLRGGLREIMGLGMVGFGVWGSGFGARPPQRSLKNGLLLCFVVFADAPDMENLKIKPDTLNPKS